LAESKTDLFVTTISHAGISDHTSYLGEGYSYNQVSMASGYPWGNDCLNFKKIARTSR